MSPVAAPLTHQAEQRRLLLPTLWLRCHYEDTDRFHRRIARLLMRHFKEGTILHEVLNGASRKGFADVAVYSFECEAAEAENLLPMARDHCPPAVKDIEHAIFAATAG